MLKIIYFILFFLLSINAFADKNMKIGVKGKLNEVDRTVKVIMYDNYYEPKTLEIKAGETINFEVLNAGVLVHEFNIANSMMHKNHQPEMKKMFELGILKVTSIDKEKMKKMAKIDKAMAHSHSNSLLLQPGEKANLIWKFDNAINIEIACNVPGHYQAGMIATVNIN
tara:strand:- start:1724 stop:2227 length:504 start_codon:yes stop_codon:yes gene_type:complete